MDYTFAPGVHACLADGRLVILNVRADRYLMLPPEVEQSVLRLVNGHASAPADSAIHQRLCTGGLVLQRSRDRGLRLCNESVPTSSLIDGGWPRPNFSTVINNAAYVVMAMAMLRVRGLDHALRRVENVPTAADDADDVSRVAGGFAELRLVVRSLDRCLPLSIALALAAKKHHRDIRLVLGVACHPFRAHAWVQHGPIVLNDRLDTVRTFTPILSL